MYKKVEYIAIMIIRKIPAVQTAGIQTVKHPRPKRPGMFDVYFFSGTYGIISLARPAMVIVCK